MKRIERTTVHYAFDRAQPPVLTAANGETVVFDCIDCYGGELREAGEQARRRVYANPATGPLYVEGAEPGDVLQVEILDISLDGEGYMRVGEGLGIYENQGRHVGRYPVKQGEILFENGIRIPARPMIGVIGVAPAEGPISTDEPGEHGGNLDIRDLGAGSVLYLPVNAPGALLSMGDLHAVQGDGETAICALETGGAVTVRVTVLKGREDIPTPFLVTETAYLTTAAHESLDQCSVAAARKMHRFLTDHSPLDGLQAAAALSLMGNLRISQVVNPKKGCVMEFPRNVAGLEYNYYWQK